jgi:hypothetical protein
MKLTQLLKKCSSSLKKRYCRLRVCWCIQLGDRVEPLWCLRVTSCRSIHGHCWKHLNFLIVGDLIWKLELISFISWVLLNNGWFSLELDQGQLNGMNCLIRIRVLSLKNFLLGILFLMLKWDLWLILDRRSWWIHLVRFCNGLMEGLMIKINLGRIPLRMI